MVLVLVVAGSWFYWASQRPGGVSGTVNGWIDHVRGKIVAVSADPDLARATKVFNERYADAGSYPRMTDDQLATAGVGIGVTVVWCTPSAMVLQASAGGGTVSRLLLSGASLGNVAGNHACPTDFADPEPWKRPG